MQVFGFALRGNNTGRVARSTWFLVQTCFQCLVISCEHTVKTQLAHNARVVGVVLESMRRVDRLTGALLEDGHLSEEEQQRINSQPTLTKRTQYLLRVLNNKPQQAFHCFLRALRDTDQGYLSDLLTGQVINDLLYTKH